MKKKLYDSWQIHGVNEKTTSKKFSDSTRVFLLEESHFTPSHDVSCHTTTPLIAGKQERVPHKKKFYPMSAVTY